MSQQQQPGGAENINAYVAPDLEYCYRDIANIFVGSGEVTFEFGNIHKSAPGTAAISNRIVMSLGNAYDLQQRLQQALMQAQQAMLEAEKNQQG